MRFRGFPESALDFYEGLAADNSKTYWTAHRDTYESDVKAPMVDLLADLEPEFGPATLYRPYRDVRFSKDKTPYKTSIAAGVGAYYLQLTADGLMIGGGIYHTATDQVARLRRSVDDGVQGPVLERIVSGLRADGWSVDGERVSTTPRGYDRDHPRIELLRHKSMIGWRSWTPAGWLHTARTRTRVRDGWRELAPLVVWLGDHVGPSDVPRERR